MSDLEGRLGAQVFQKRLSRERSVLGVQNDSFLAKLYGRIVSSDVLLGWVFRLVGLLRRGQRNAADLRLVEHDFVLSRLPDCFDGFRLLQLSDLHYGCVPNLNDHIRRVLKGVDVDACVITGDFYFLEDDPVEAVVSDFRALLADLPSSIFSILGNHDRLDLVAPFESMGVRVLLNEALPLERGDDRLWIAGVDDPYYFETDDAIRARKNIPKGEASILLSHSPENFIEAALLGYDVMLSGHTHGGQVCLPGGFPLINHARAPLSVNGGAWSCGSLQGYTSRGTGATSIDVRINCPAEVTVHTFRKRSF